MISLIAAISKNNCIGKDGQIPWHIPEDLRRVKAYTMGKCIIMGRNTWDSIPIERRPLPGRTNIIITTRTDTTYPSGVEIYPTIELALAAHPQEDVVGFGGQRIYESLMPFAEELYISHIHQTIENGTAFFPTIDPQVWKEVNKEPHDGYDVITYRKKSSTL